MGGLAVFIATFGYVGYFPIAPGTAGSLAALLLYAAVRWAGTPAVELATMIAVLATGIWAASGTERALDRKDPGPVVIDEVLGMLMTLAFMPLSWGGIAAGFVLLLGFALPPIVALRRVPTLRVLRRDLGLPDSAGWAGYAVGVAALGGLLLWEAQDAKTGWYVLGGAVGTMAALALVTLALLRLATWSGRRAPFAWRFGLANLQRRRLHDRRRRRDDDGARDAPIHRNRAVDRCRHP